MGSVTCMDLIYRFFDAVNMHRWNDHLRPVDLTELDKQAHKAAITWILGKYEEHENGTVLDWTRMIEGCLFSFMKRTVLTDLKPQLLHRMEEERFAEVNEYVLSEIRKEIPQMDPGFFARFESYINDKHECIEDRIVAAAHYLATNWEFNLIYDLNSRSYGIEQTRATINMEMSEFTDLIGVKKVLATQSMSFLDLIGQLRFQKRWTRVPRIPETTVLGHSLMVAIVMYLHDLDAGADARQRYNDFFSGLFHDLPEVLTKDVISPVKVNVHGLADLLDEYEHEMIESKMMPLMPDAWKGEFSYLLYDPFSAKDHKEYGKVAGRELKMCDIFCAYIEANVSRRYGITSSKLREGEESLRKRLEEEGGCIDASGLIKRLNEMHI